MPNESVPERCATFVETALLRHKVWIGTSSLGGCAKCEEASNRFGNNKI